MRLLDMIAQYRDPFVVLANSPGAVPMIVSGPRDFAKKIAECPLRFVIADDLTQASAELAFSEGDQLATCLDLVRIPATQLWVEWSDAVHQKVITQCGIVPQPDPSAIGRQVGVLLEATPDGRSAVARTFWSVSGADGACEAQMSPLETFIDLDGHFAATVDPDAMLRGHYASLALPDDHGIDQLLRRVCFRFDVGWLKYYEAAAPDAKARHALARASLAAVAHDTPLLLAFFLLLHARGATRPIAISREAINRKRRAHHRAPLLDHIEVCASLPQLSSARELNAADADSGRRSPRLHHVRGHLVRREDRVFWRTPHLRGSALAGVVRSRTVCLSFAQAS